jgi:hypothetical protein
MSRRVSRRRSAMPWKRGGNSGAPSLSGLERAARSRVMALQDCAKALIFLDFSTSEWVRAALFSVAESPAAR